MDLSCPVPISKYDKVVMGHGGGGRLSNDLVEGLIVSELGNSLLDVMHDGAIFKASGKMAFSTDSFVVSPLFFPGGNIGELAVYGTVNDVACCGAIPRYISLSLIIEEGFSMAELGKIVHSISVSSAKAGVKVITGDTKVVEKGKGDKIFINTTGIGEVINGINVSPASCRPGDLVLINGFIGDHGIAIMSSREGLEYETTITSDCAPLNKLVEDICGVCPGVKVFRDPTRGGVASSLNEISKASGFGITLEEDKIPVREEVKGVCEILGFDPLYVANEGKMLVIVPRGDAEKVLAAMRENEQGKNSAIIGEVTDNGPGVKLNTIIGSTRVVDMISGEQLPRIC